MKVSIGIPIYSGEVYLEETLKSILAQSFTDYEIILADNNPGGQPRKIAEQYSERCQNIHYHIHEKNIGALANWNSLIEFAQGEYFICAGGHDLWTSNLLQELVDILENNAKVVVAYAPSQWMTVEGIIENYTTGFVDTTGYSDVARYNAIFWGGQDALYGLMRLKTIKRTRLQRQIVGSGAVWLGELALFGDFQVALNAIRYRRRNREESGRERRLLRYHQTLFKRKRIRVLPFWRMGCSYCISVFRGNLSFLSRFRIILSVNSNFIFRYGLEMFYDICSLFYRVLTFKIFRELK